MRGVPSLMTPRMTSSLPPAVSLDSAGPKVRALICGGRWHTPQDWAKTRRPVVCVSLRVSSVAACCAGAASGHAKSASTRAAALRVIFESSLDCTFSNFLKSMPARRRAEGANLEPGGVTGMRRARSGRALRQASPLLPGRPRATFGPVGGLLASAPIQAQRGNFLLSVHPPALPGYGHSKAAVEAFLRRLGYDIRCLAVDHEEHWWCKIRT